MYSPRTLFADGDFRAKREYFGMAVVPFTNGYFNVDGAQLASEFVHKHEGVANGSDGPSLIGLN
jgi:hypothetical protein